ALLANGYACSNVAKNVTGESLSALSVLQNGEQSDKFERLRCGGEIVIQAVTKKPVTDPAVQYIQNRPLFCRSICAFDFFTRFLFATGLLLCFVQPSPSQDIHFALPVLNATDQLELGLAFSNPTAQAVTLRLTARDYSGSVIAGPQITNPAAIDVPAFGQRSLMAKEVFGAGIAVKSGWIDIASPLEE